MAFKFKNGDAVRCLVTDFTGHVFARADHLTGCNRYLVQPPVDEKGNMRDGFWLDEPQLIADRGKPQIVLEQLQAGQPPG